MIVLVVSWDKAPQGGTKLLKEVSYTAEIVLKWQDTRLLHLRRLCTVTVDSYYGLEMYSSVCNVTMYFCYRGQPYGCAIIFFKGRKIFFIKWS